MLKIMSALTEVSEPRAERRRERRVDMYFSADIETDGPIPGPYSMLSFAMVYAGTFDGEVFHRPDKYEKIFYRELCPISREYETEALEINGLDRAQLLLSGIAPSEAMSDAANWIRDVAGDAKPVLVAYPLSFDWTWLYWYFVRFSKSGSPFSYSSCFDIKTAYSVKAKVPIAEAGRSQLDIMLKSEHRNTHHAVDDAIAQAEVFANVFEWSPKS
jgi:DNA polymerase III epsilon subunit-like protein